MLIQYGLHKALKGRTSNMKKTEWEELDLRAASAICLCLAKNVLVKHAENDDDKGTVEETWRLILGKGHLKSIVIEGKVS